MHTFHADGLLARLVAIAFSLGTGLPGTWLRPAQVRAASSRVMRTLGHSVTQLFKTSLESRRQLAAYAVWALEGQVRSNEQKRHLALLRDVMLVAAEEDREERLLERLPQMQELAVSVVGRSRDIYGAEFVNRSKVHRLLHLYKGTGQWSPTHGRRNYRNALAYGKPPLKHFSMWRGERLQKHAKRAGRKVYRAKVDRQGRNVRFLRVLNQEAERWALKVRMLPAPFLPAARAQGAGAVDGVDLGGGRQIKAGEMWLVRLPELNVMKFNFAKVLELQDSQAGFLVRVRLYDSSPHECPLPPGTPAGKRPGTRIERRTESHESDLEFPFIQPVAS
jgi:hypothetical protein